MATSVYSWSTTAADNDDADTNINWAEGQNASTVNNSARQMMAALASSGQAMGGGLTTGGTGAAYTLTLADAPSAYSTSMLFLVKWNVVSTSTTATINVNSMGAKTLKTWDNATLPSAGHLTANSYAFIKYDGSAFRVFTPTNIETGTFTPALTFTTPGDLSVTYTTQLGTYTKIGNVCYYWIEIVTSAFTHTTASGNFRISGMPFTHAASTANATASPSRGGSRGSAMPTKPPMTQASCSVVSERAKAEACTRVGTSRWIVASRQNFASDCDSPAARPSSTSGSTP